MTIQRLQWISNNISQGRINLLITILAVLLNSVSFAETLPLKRYTVSDGLLRDRVLCVTQDSQGFMWFCTLEGVSMFNGYEFKNFTTDDGLPNRIVNQIIETKRGDILIATHGGLAKLNPTGLRDSQENPLFEIYIPEDSVAKSINVLHEDENGQLWCGTAAGIYRVNVREENIEFEKIPLLTNRGNKTNAHFKTMEKDSQGNFWFGSYTEGLVRLLPNGKAEHFSEKEGLELRIIEVIFEDKDGRIWIGLRDTNEGLILLKKNIKPNQNIVERKFSIKEGIPHGWITEIFQTSSGNIWIGTISKACILQEKSKNSVCQEILLENDYCRLSVELKDIYEDKQKNLWLATMCGVFKLKQNGFTTYTEKDGLPTSYSESFFETSDGDFIAVTKKGKNHINQRRLLSRFDGHKFHTLTPNYPTEIKYMGWGIRQTIAIDKDKNWYFPATKGLLKFANVNSIENLKNRIPQTITSEIKNTSVFITFVDSRGDLWVSIQSPDGLFRLDTKNKKWVDHTDKGLVKTPRLVSAMGEDNYGNVWIGASHSSGNAALIRYKNGKFKLLQESEGAPKGWYRDFFTDSKGRLWIATQNEGVWRIDSPDSNEWNFIKYDRKRGLSTNDIQSITEDTFGRIYLATGNGLNRLDLESNVIEIFGVKDGLPSHFLEVAYRDKQKNLWFVTRGGLVKYKPEPKKERLPPKVFITGLQIAGIDQPVSLFGENKLEGFELSSDQREVRINFSGIGSDIGEKLTYEYRLLGANEDWVKINERTIDFANLQSGKYRFEVRAKTVDKVYSSNSASVSFYIAKPFWQRWYFILATFALIGFIIYFAYRRRVAKLLEIERMRTRIASDLHDDVGANLTRISILSEVANQQINTKNQTQEYLPSIAEIARKSVSSMNDIVWAISPQNESLVELTRRMRLFAEEVLTLKNIELEFSTTKQKDDMRLSIELRHDLLLIFKEAVNNAAKYSGCTKVKVDFFIKHSMIHLLIVDNGRGFDTTKETDGNGLINMQRRAKSFGGKLKINSNSNGTEINLEMPLK